MQQILWHLCQEGSAVLQSVQLQYRLTPAAAAAVCGLTCSVMRLMTRVTGRPLDTAGWKVSNLMYLQQAQNKHRWVGPFNNRYTFMRLQPPKAITECWSAQQLPENMQQQPWGRSTATLCCCRCHRMLCCICALPTKIPGMPCVHQPPSPVSCLAVAQAVDAVPCDAALPQHCVCHCWVDRLQGSQGIALDLHSTSVGAAAHHAHNTASGMKRGLVPHV